jgi:glycosyltransferase involved in cell wall biosynthesis
VLAGDGEVERLRKLVTARGLDDSCEVRTWLGPGQVRDLLASSEVMVLPSRAEGQPIAVLEAMAAGLCVISTTVGGIPDLVEDGTSGLLVPPSDIDALSAALRRVLTDDALVRRLGAAAFQRAAAEFDVTAVAARLHDLYTSTLGSAAEDVPQKPISLCAVMDVTAVGGAEVQFLELFRNLDPRYVRPRVVCLREEGPLAPEFRRSGIPVDALLRRSRLDVRTLPRLVRYLRVHRADAVLVLHFHRASVTLGRVAALATRTPSMLAVRDMGLTAVGRRCLPRYVVNSLFLFDVLLLQAPSQGRYLHDEEGVGRHPWSRTPEVVIANGVPLRAPPGRDDRRAGRRLLGLADDDIVMGIVARLSPQKAHHVLIEAFAKSVAVEPRLRLVIVGGGTRDAELRELVRQRGITERVLFTGTRRDVPQLWPAFDVACLSSVHEGTPVSVIEAMSACLPVLATDCGAIRDMVTEGEEGYIVPVGDVAALSARIDRLAADPELRDELGARGRKRAERDFRVDLMAREFTRLLGTLTRKGGNGAHG